MEDNSCRSIVYLVLHYFEKGVRRRTIIVASMEYYNYSSVVVHILEISGKNAPFGVFALKRNIFRIRVEEYARCCLPIYP